MNIRLNCEYDENTLRWKIFCFVFLTHHHSIIILCKSIACQKLMPSTYLHTKQKLSKSQEPNHRTIQTIYDRLIHIRIGYNVNFGIIFVSICNVIALYMCNR